MTYFSCVNGLFNGPRKLFQIPFSKMKVLFNVQGYGRMSSLLMHAMSSDKRGNK